MVEIARRLIEGSTTIKSSAACPAKLARASAPARAAMPLLTTPVIVSWTAACATAARLPVFHRDRLRGYLPVRFSRALQSAKMDGGGSAPRTASGWRAVSLEQRQLRSAFAIPREISQRERLDFGSGGIHCLQATEISTPSCWL